MIIDIVTPKVYFCKFKAQFFITSFSTQKMKCRAVQGLSIGLKIFKIRPKLPEL